MRNFVFPMSELGIVRQKGTEMAIAPMHSSGKHGFMSNDRTEIRAIQLNQFQIKMREQLI